MGPAERARLVADDGPGAAAKPETVDATSPSKFAHITALDGLRGLAVVLVVLSHFAPGIAPGGFLGVDLFFVLSGFLITSLLVAEIESTGGTSLSNFWVRRARRLFPALLLVVFAAVAVAWLTATHEQTHRVGADGLGALFYVANWRFVLSGQSYIRQFLDTAPSPLRHTWSLAIEEQFYLVWPLVVVALSWAIARVRGRRAVPVQIRPWLTAVSAGLAGVSFLWLLVLYRSGTDLDRLYYGTDTRVFLILAGATVGAATAGRPVCRTDLGRGSVLIGGMLGIAALLLLSLTAATDQKWLYAGGFGAIAVMLVVVLVAAAQPGRNPVARFLSVRPLVSLGLISYGVYLWHWPIDVWVRQDTTGLDGPALFAVRCILTLAVSVLSYKLVEQPIRTGSLPRIGSLPPRGTVALIVAGVVLSLLLPVMVFPGVAATPQADRSSTTASQVTLAYSRSARCDLVGKPAPLSPRRRLLIQIEGNSLAGEITPCLSRILSARNAEVERVEPPGFLLCRDIPAIEEQVKSPATRPDAAVVFLFTAYDNRCGAPWHGPVDRLVAMYKKYGVHAYLVPSVPIVKGARDDLAPGPLQEDEYYRRIAAADPKNLTFVDAGVFLRDLDGRYLWQMPCTDSKEAGCAKDGTVGVRFVDGLHFCTDPNFGAHGCPETRHQAGERRAAAGIAQVLLPSLQRRFG